MLFHLVRFRFDLCQFSVAVIDDQFIGVPYNPSVEREVLQGVADVICLGASNLVRASSPFLTFTGNCSAGLFGRYISNIGLASRDYRSKTVSTSEKTENYSPNWHGVSHILI
jgi:hypothetical protein